MSRIQRRDILKGAIFGGFVLTQVVTGEEFRPMTDLEGRPVQRIKDPAAMTDIEKLHLITIDVPPEIKQLQPFKVTFALPNHPMERNHHIFWARTYLDTQGVSYLTFAPMWQRPEATLTYTFSAGTRLDVIVECNEDGLWGASAPLNIKTGDAGAAVTLSST